MTKRLAIVVDIDETICTQFDVPVNVGIELLKQIDDERLTVFYVTARTEICRVGTETFFATYDLPGQSNILFCPDSLDSFEHKRKQHEYLARNFEVVASIGDSQEEEQASAAAGIPFCYVDPCNPAEGWLALAARIAQVNGFSENNVAGLPTIQGSTFNRASQT